MAEAKQEYEWNHTAWSSHRIRSAFVKSEYLNPYESAAKTKEKADVREVSGDTWVGLLSAACKKVVKNG